MKLSIVVPIYNEGESLLFLKEELDILEASLEGVSCEFILVDDGSTDQTEAYIKQFAASSSSYRYIIFSRNFGKESAMLAGMAYASGDIIGIMDADLQHDPAMIPEMLQAITDEGYDVAASRRSDRDESSKTYTRVANWFYKIFNALNRKADLEVGAQDFRLMRRPVVEAILSMPESQRFSKGLFSWVGFETKWFEAKDHPRVAGESKWNLFSSIRYALDGILSFSALPLRLSFFIGAVIAVLGIIYGLYIVIKTLLVGGDVPGYPSLMAGLLFIGGIILLCLGIVGEYIARIYEEVKNRPHYIIKEQSKSQSEKGK